MRFQRILAAACIVLPLLILSSMGCAIFTFPGDGIKAASANAQVIKLHIDIVDQDHWPLDGVKVEIIRHTLEANMLISGNNTSDAPEPPRVVDKILDYSTLGACAVTITFSKDGYFGFTQTYANTDFVEGSPNAFSGPVRITCFNVQKHSPSPAVLTKSEHTPHQPT